MTTKKAPTSGASWGPDGQRAAISLTFDNLGEAAELERGTWLKDREIGSHHSVSHVLPTLLDVLASHAARATFFVEGWNAETYPEALESISDGGHEIGVHGWMHENWGSLPPQREADLFDRAIHALKDIGVVSAGFRPPGGTLTGHSLQLLREAGFSYCSPAARAVSFSQDIAILPFEWKAIDAYYLSERLAPLRKTFGDSAEQLGTDRFNSAVQLRLSELLEDGGYLALIFHPVLQDSPERLETMRSLIDQISAREEIWCAPCSEVAEWVKEQRIRFDGAPLLDEQTWG